MAQQETKDSDPSRGMNLEHWPILIRRASASLTTLEWQKELDWAAELYRTKKEPYALVVDARSGRRPNSAERNMMREFAEKHDAHIRQYCRGTALVFKSDLVRGALTALLWLRKPASQTKVFTDFDEAMAWARKQLDL